MKIQHVITTLDVGGAEMHLLTQVRGQIAAGHDVRVAWLKGRGSLAEEFRCAGAQVEGLSLLRCALLLRRMRAADVVHSHLLKADALCAALAACGGCSPRLISGKHNDEQILTRPIVSRVHGVLGNVPARTIVLSDHVGRFVARHGRVRTARIVRIYYGVDPLPFERAAAAPPEARRALRSEFGFADEHVVFVCVARFAAQKAHDVLLRAFARARADDPRLRLLLVGGDPFGDGEERTRALAAELDLGGTCVFAGIRRDVPALLAAADAFTMASLWEGLGLVFLEAMAAGLPILATNVSAVPEVVVDGVCGMLVPAGDAAALAAGMLALGSDADRRRRLGDAGRARVRERFSLQRMWRETLAVYEQVVAAAGGER